MNDAQKLLHTLNEATDVNQERDIITRGARGTSDLGKLAGARNLVNLVSSTHTRVGGTDDQKAIRLLNAAAAAIQAAEDYLSR